MDGEAKTEIPSVVDDPRELSVARVYASAYLDGIDPQNISSSVEELSSFIDDILSQQPDFDRLLRGQSIGRDAKLQLIDRIVGGRGSERFVSLLKVLARHDRLALLPSIRTVAVSELERRSGQRRVRVTSAVELTESSTEAIRNSLRTSLNAEPILEAHVDSTLIGGLIIRVGDTVYDGSVKTQVKQLRARLRERCLNEIQRGRDRFSHPEGN